MPAWSTEIANEFIRLGARNGRAFDQMQLQKLVYIAHGWCLAITGDPLTGDRPEAWDFGPIYRRLADALAQSGRRPVERLIEVAAPLATVKPISGQGSMQSDLEPIEMDIIQRVSAHYGALSSARLSALTLGEDAPWPRVYRGGEGRFHDIPHGLIRDQFVHFAQRIGEDRNRD